MKRRAKPKEALLEELEEEDKLVAELAESEAERKQAVETLRETRDYLENLINYASAPIIVWDPNTRITRFNRAFEHLTGYAADEVIGQELPILFPEGSRDESLSSIARTLSGERWESVEIPILRKDGETRLALWNSANVYAADGSTLLATIAQGMDITELKRAGEMLRETRDYLENLINYASAPIIVWDPNTRITRFNRAFENLAGYAADEVIGQELPLLFPEGSRNKSLSSIARTLSGTRWESVEIPILRKDGETRLALWNSANIYAEDGSTLLATIAQGTDITERKQAEDRLKNTMADLERSNKELEQFAYVASHDLQEPLRMVSSYTQLLARRYEDQLDQDAHEFIGYAVDGAERMQRIINDLLAYSRGGTRGKPFGKTDCQEALQETLANLQAAIEETDATVTHDPLPTVLANESQLTRVFQNLVSNVIKFHGEAPPRVHIGADRRDGEWVFSVRDNGIGIDPQYHERIFVIFQTLHARDQYPGTGIGLAPCKRIVERHGGRIWVESALGEGATFYFTIPDKEVGKDE